MVQVNFSVLFPFVGPACSHSSYTYGDSSMSYGYRPEAYSCSLFLYGYDDLVRARGYRLLTLGNGSLTHGSSSAACGYRSYGCLWLFLKNFLFLLLVKEVKQVENKQLVYYPMVVTCAPLKIIGGWTLQHEDPALFAPNNLQTKHRREWPDQPYPTLQSGQGATSDVTPTHTKQELDQLLKIHHEVTKLIKKMGVDPCKDFKDSRVKSILLSIDSSDLECKVCGKVYSSASRMRQHIQAKHIGVTNYQCTTCLKYYVNEQSLQAHIGRGHDIAKTFKCPKCTKSFATASQLTQHQPLHDGPKYECEFTPLGCTRKYVYKRGKVDHERKCKKNPAHPKPDKQCEVCPKKVL